MLLAVGKFFQISYTGLLLTECVISLLILHYLHVPKGGGHWDFRFCGFGYFLDQFFGFCCKRLRFFGFGGHRGLRIFRFLASGFWFS